MRRLSTRRPALAGISPGFPTSSSTRSNRARSALALVTPLILALMAMLTPGVVHATTAEGINVPVVTNFCGAGTVVVEFTICNDSAETTTHHVSFTAGVEVYGCGESVIPEHTFLDDPHPTLAPGACTTIRAEIVRPPELSTFPSVCYWIRVDVEPGAAYYIGATLQDQPLLCFDWYFEEWAPFVHPEDPVTFAVDVYNISTQPVEFLALFEIWGLDGDTGQEVLSLNGFSPGTPVLQPIEIAEGEMTTLAVEVEWLDALVFGFYNLVLIREDTLEPIASIGIGHRPEAPVAVEDTSMEDPATPLVEIHATPNPSSGTSELQFDLQASVSGATVVILDVSGRVVRTLFQGEDLAAGTVRVGWDGLDVHGSRVPSGVYWARLRTSHAEATHRLIRVE